MCRFLEGVWVYFGGVFKVTVCLFGVLGNTMAHFCGCSSEWGVYLNFNLFNSPSARQTQTGVPFLSPLLVTVSG